MFRRRKQCFCFALPPLRQRDNIKSQSQATAYSSPALGEVAKAEGLQTEGAMFNLLSLQGTFKTPSRLKPYSLYKQRESYLNNSNNIAVDPGAPCHTEQSEVSLFCVVMRSFTSVQDDKFANNVNIGSTAIILPK